MFAGPKPWHGLGTMVEETTTPAEALKIANLDWKVSKRQLFYKKEVEEGVDQYEEAETSYATVRDDTQAYLGTVGAQYTPIQNKEQSDFIEALAGEGNTVVECVGALFGGKKTFWTCRLPDSLTIGANDNIEEYLIVSNDHAGRGSFRVFYSPIRVVCNNTLAMSLSGINKDASISLRHSGNIASKISEAKRVLSIASDAYTETAEVYSKIAESTVDPDILATLIDHSFDVDEDRAKTDRWAKTRTDVMNNIRLEQSTINTDNSAWAAYNGITRYLTHSAGKDRSKRFVSLADGRYNSINKKALRVFSSAMVTLN